MSKTSATGEVRQFTVSADDDGIRPGGYRFGNVTAVLDSAVCDDRDAVTAGRRRAVQDCSYLRNANAGHDAGGAD